MEAPMVYSPYVGMIHERDTAATLLRVGYIGGVAQPHLTMS